MTQNVTLVPIKLCPSCLQCSPAARLQLAHNKVVRVFCAVVAVRFPTVRFGAVCTNSACPRAKKLRACPSTGKNALFPPTLPLILRVTPLRPYPRHNGRPTMSLRQARSNGAGGFHQPFGIRFALGLGFSARCQPQTLPSRNQSARIIGHPSACRAFVRRRIRCCQSIRRVQERW